MDFFKVLSVKKTKEKLKEMFSGIALNLEKVDILNSLDRISGEDIESGTDVPGFDRSTVDGYAIMSFDSHGAGDNMPAFFDVIGEVAVGESSDLKISSGQAVYVPTGGMIPEGADSMVMVEYAENLDENHIAVYKPVSSSENIVYKGDDIKKGQVVLKRGKRITPFDIGVIAAMGISKLNVYEKPKFYIISTGDEIIDLDIKEDISKGAGPGKIRDINGYALYSMVKKIGGDVVNKVIVKDDVELLKKETGKALESSHIVLISGGSSVGTRDFTRDVINSFEGRGVFVHGISMKPGKPTLIGEAEGKAVFGLPGHPVSAIMVFKVFVEYLVKEILGIQENISGIKAIMGDNVHSSPGRETYQMVSLEKSEGKLYAISNYGKSGMITLLSRSCGYVIIKEDEEGLDRGDVVDVHLI